jgi:pimeloyl-ACP methyl ester carboxylesterase
MDTVRSRDGTLIAFKRSGAGPPLVLVHGSTADHSRWDPLLPELGRRFEVYAMDRRGRGGSGDAASYAIEAEYDDVAAVVETAGAGASLLGHSYGGLCALEAALRVSNLRSLLLYEPVFATEAALYPPAARQRLEALDRQGDRELLLTTFFREIVEMPEEDIEKLRADPSWLRRIAAAHTLVREFADADYVFEPARFRGLAVPTLLLVGGSSPPAMTRPSELIAEALPDARIVVMPGQGHAAMNTAPDLFLREVIGFLTR